MSGANDHIPLNQPAPLPSPASTPANLVEAAWQSWIAGAEPTSPVLGPTAESYRLAFNAGYRAAVFGSPEVTRA